MYGCPLGECGVVRQEAGRSSSGGSIPNLPSKLVMGNIYSKAGYTVFDNSGREFLPQAEAYYGKMGMVPPEENSFAFTTYDDMYGVKNTYTAIVDVPVQAVPVGSGLAGGTAAALQQRQPYASDENLPDVRLPEVPQQVFLVAPVLSASGNAVLRGMRLRMQQGTFTRRAMLYMYDPKNGSGGAFACIDSLEAAEGADGATIYTADATIQTRAAVERTWEFDPASTFIRTFELCNFVGTTTNDFTIEAAGRQWQEALVTLTITNPEGIAVRTNLFFGDRQGFVMRVTMVRGMLVAGTVHITFASDWLVPKGTQFTIVR